MLKPYLLLIFSIFIVFITLFLTYIFKIYDHAIWIEEGGIIETVSFLGYFVCALLMLFKGGWEYIKKYHYFFLLVIFFGLRELDLDKKFTTMGIFKSNFYRANEIPIIEKLIGFMIILILIYIIASILKNHAKEFLTKLKTPSPVHVGTLTILLFLFVSKAMDGLARKLNWLDISINQQTSLYFEIAEETLEMGIPLLIISTFLIFHSNWNKTTS